MKFLTDLIDVGTLVPDNATNGDIIMALFPNCVVDIDEDGWFMTNLDGCSNYTPKWWNAPYKAEK